MGASELCSTRVDRDVGRVGHDAIGVVADHDLADHRRHQMDLRTHHPPERRRLGHHLVEQLAPSGNGEPGLLEHLACESAADVLGVVGLDDPAGWGPIGRTVAPQVLHEQQPGIVFDDRSGDDPLSHDTIFPDSTPLRASGVRTQIDIRSASRPST